MANVSEDSVAYGMHACTSTYMTAYIYTYMPMYICVHIYTYIYMYLDLHRHTPTHLPTQAQIHVETRTETHKERHAHRAASDCLACSRVASSDVREVENTKSSFVPISGCFAGRLLLYPLAVVLLVGFFCTH